MSDLISRSELVKLLEDRKREHYENYESFRNYMGYRRVKHETEYEECKRILSIITSQPTVEDVLVVHGEWRHLGGDEWGCTECGHVITTEGSWEKPTKKFCEECGADMRKKV